MKMSLSNQDIILPVSVVAEEWWQSIMQEWKRYIKPCLNMFLKLNEPVPKRLKAESSLGEYLEDLIRRRDPEITFWLKKAFFNAPNSPELIGSVRGWTQLLSLLDTTHLLHGGMQLYDDRAVEIEKLLAEESKDGGNRYE